MMIRYALPLILAVAGLLVASGCETGPGAAEAGGDQQSEQSERSEQSEQVRAPASAEQAVAQREQQEGKQVPDVSVRTMDGRTRSLRDLATGRPTLLVFYRGGWCPYCNAHLAELQATHDELREMGFEVLAISPDRPSELQASADKQQLDYTLLSDSDMRAADAMGLAFRVDEPTVTRYLEEHEIDLEASSGRKHHMLPVPAVFLADAEGRIVYEHVDPDYRRRLSGERILAAAREATDSAG